MHSGQPVVMALATAAAAPSPDNPGGGTLDFVLQLLQHVKQGVQQASRSRLVPNDTCIASAPGPKLLKDALI
jgi:hypothetical protein